MRFCLEDFSSSHFVLFGGSGFLELAFHKNRWALGGVLLVFKWPVTVLCRHGFEANWHNENYEFCGVVLCFAPGSQVWGLNLGTRLYITLVYRLYITRPIARTPINKARGPY